MRGHVSRLSATGAIFVVLWLAAFGPAAGQVPPEIEAVGFASESELTWAPAPTADDYNVYRGRITDLLAGTPLRCHADEIEESRYLTPAEPPPGDVFAFLVTGESDVEGEGSAGSDSGGESRALLGRCDTVIRTHLLRRIGFGEDEWSRQRLATLGIAGYVEEQLAPATITENPELASRLAPLSPAENLGEGAAQTIVRAVYARRQLEHSVTMFWVNHFNTAFQDIAPFFARPTRDVELTAQITIGTQIAEMDRFRELAFSGTFRDIVEASVLSPAMILYLDTNENVVGAPNENMARELLELYTQGVDNGYTQKDVEELARVLTGWTVCKKTPDDAGDPLAPCIPRYLEDLTDGEWVPHFRVAEHDPGEKILYEGTAYQTVIPDTSATPVAGVDDVQIALDAIAARPETREFISNELLVWFLSDDPPQDAFDEVVARWDATGGSLPDILRTIVTHPRFLDPDLIGTKIRTPIEHIAAAFRATRGATNGRGPLRGYLVNLAHVPHGNVVPTGYPEVGPAWVDTTGVLQRQNFGLEVTASTDSRFGTELVALMADNGLDASSAPEAIVDFWVERLFGGALTPSERGEAIDYLTTDDAGTPAPVDDDRIRETVGFLLGYPHFNEQ